MQVTLVSPSFILRGVAKVNKVLYVLVLYLEVSVNPLVEKALSRVGIIFCGLVTC
jgi:hypothetical protein